MGPGVVRRTEPYLPLLAPSAPGRSGQSLRLLAQALGREVGDQPRELEWAGAIRYLAGEILATVGTDTARLRTLQRDVLIPVERRLASDWFVTVSPAKLVTLVSHSLERC